MHEVFRVPQKNRTEPVSQGLRNFYVVTGGRERETPLGKGINPIRDHASTGCTPAIVLSSSPWKAGSETTPWHDVFDLQGGHVRYFGDSKAGSTRAAEDETGNAALLAEYTHHRGANAAARARATPLLLFRAVTRDGANKGYREFCGLGVIEGASRVVQWDEPTGSSFVNYAYDIALLDLSRENDLFDWRWINTRASRGADAAMRFAPASWSRWIGQGDQVMPKIRRRMALGGIKSKRAQLPPAGSADANVLKQVYQGFHGNKHAFESLASKVVGQILGKSGANYLPGWITKASADHGIDFVSRLDVGNGAASVKLVVLGQAKCIKPDGPAISAEALARVVSRLRRGWLGAYVITGTYSDSAQKELVTDEYPLLLVDGKILAAEVRLLAAESYGGDVGALLGSILASHGDAILHRRPEEILDDDGFFSHEP